MLQRGRPCWDDDRVPSTPAIVKNPFAGFLANWRDRRLRLLPISGGAFCWAQFCVAAYTVVTCVEVLGMNLISGRKAIYSFLDWEKENHEIQNWFRRSGPHGKFVGQASAFRGISGGGARHRSGQGGSDREARRKKGRFS